MSKFITLEGTEGAGKTSALSVLTKMLEDANIDYVTTREPGGTVVAEQIRALLLAKNDEPLHPDCELLLVFAARAQHYQHFILPNLQTGKWVISDRFVDASYAYQGGGRRIAFSRIRQLETWALGDFEPDISLFLNVSIDTGLQRAAARNTPDRFESEQHAFFEAVAKAYQKRIEQQPQRFICIDAEQDIQAVSKDIEKQFGAWLAQEIKTSGVSN